MHKIHKRAGHCLQYCEQDMMDKTDRQTRTFIKFYSHQAVNSLCETKMHTSKAKCPPSQNLTVFSRRNRHFVDTI